MTSENILKDTVVQLFERDLGRLEKEILAYKDETKLWVKDGDISNSAGNLVLHMTGNLRHFIGAVLGQMDFERDRASEFVIEGLT